MVLKINGLMMAGKNPKLVASSRYGFVYDYKGKGKVTPLQARLWPRGGRGIALLFQDLGARRG
jgi:hypothetical protein